MAINLYSKASVDSLLSAKLSISSLTNAAATTLNATAPTTGQVLSFDGTELKWATPAGGATWGSITGTLSSQSDLNTALNARVSTAGDTMDNNALLEFNDTTTNSHLGITGNAVTIENAGLGLSSTLDKDKLSITDGTDTAEFTLAGINFADGSVQTTAYTGGGGGSGTLTYSSPYIYDTVTASNITALDLGSGTLTANVINAANATLNGSGLTLTASSGAVITFADATTQSTAGMLASDNLSTLTNTATARTNLGLGGLAVINDAASDGTTYGRKNGAWTSISGGGGVDVQTFGSSTTSGSFTWTKPAGAKRIEVWLWGAGGGAGSGARQATTVARGGGGGGGAGSLCHQIMDPAEVGASATVVVGAGGAGGAARTTDNTSGLTGTAGGDTTFSIFKAVSGNAGSPGTNSAGGTAGGGRNMAFYFTNTFYGGGGAGQLVNGSSASGPQQVKYHSTGGGGGAGAGASVTTSYNGGSGGTISVSESGIITAIAGGSSGTNGTTATKYYQGGTGGGGGNYRTGLAGGTGGNGGWPGGGGGGGGASDNGFASGKGGDGANGFAVIITYF